MRLETERLVLRNLKSADEEDYLKYHNSEFVLRYNCMQPETPEKARSYIQKAQSNDRHVVIALKDTDAFVGMIYVEEDSLRYDADSIGISYWLGQPFAGKGYMTEALRTLIAQILEQYNTIAVRAFADNPASVGLLRRLGFVQEGRLRRAVKGWDGKVHDDLLFALFAGEDGKCS